jgi:hypothetical protein
LRSALLLLCGCSGVLWYGRDVDRARALRVEKESGGHRLVVDEVPHAVYDWIAIEGLRANADVIAYPARREGRWVLVQDGREGRPWEGIGEVVLRDREVAYAATDGASWFVVHRDRPSRKWDAIMQDSLRIEDRPLYVAELEGKQYAVVGERIIGPHDAVGAIATDGDRVLIATRDGDAVRVIGAREEPAYESVAGVVLAPGHYAYLAKRGRWRLVVDGIEVTTHDKIGMPVFSSDGARMAYVAGDDAVHVHSGGDDYGPYDFVRQSSIRFDRTHLMFIAGRNGKQHLVYDGVEGPAYDAVDDPVFGGDRWGYAGHRAEGSMIHIGRSRVRRHDMVRGTLVLDGAHWACVTLRPALRRMFVTIDGRDAVELDLEEISAAVMHSPAGPMTLDQQLRGWAEAELRRMRSAN